MVLRPDGGERYCEVAERLKEWLLSLEQAGPLVAVTHGMASAILRGLVLGLGGDDTLALDRPQDALFRVGSGRVERLAYADA